MYPKLFKEWARVLRCGGRIYALTLSQPLMTRTLASMTGTLELIECPQVEAGYKVWMYVLQRRPKLTAV